MSLQLHELREMGVSFSEFQLENGGSAESGFTGEGEEQPCDSSKEGVT